MKHTYKDKTVIYVILAFILILFYSIDQHKKKILEFDIICQTMEEFIFNFPIPIQQISKEADQEAKWILNACGDVRV